MPFVEAKYVRTNSRQDTSAARSSRRRHDRFAARAFHHRQSVPDRQALGVIRGIYGDYYGDLRHRRQSDRRRRQRCRSIRLHSTRNVDRPRQSARNRPSARPIASSPASAATFNDDWSYEVSANYGRFNERDARHRQRQCPALPARDRRGPQTGRATSSAARRSIRGGSGLEFRSPIRLTPQRRLAADVARLRAVNLFGEGNVSQAARDYILQDTFDARKDHPVRPERVRLGRHAAAFLNLPGGPIGFAVGAEYRRETALYQQDQLVNRPGSPSTIRSRASIRRRFEVKEAFGEIRIPILDGHALLRGADRQRRRPGRRL